MATAEKAIYDRLAAAPTFHPASAALFANDWALDAGDVVAVKSGDDTFSVPIYGMTLDWKGNSMVEIQSTGNEERKPISALKRRQFASGRGRYRQEKEIDGYYQRLIEEHGSIGLIAGALGVVLDADGNPVTDPTTGKLVYDENSPAEMFSRLLTTPNYAELVSALNNGTQQISGAKINLSSQGSVLIQAINNRPSGESAVTIDADKINLTGYVTATALDTRMANVDTLFTQAGYAGSIAANSMAVSTSLTASTVYADSFVFRDTGTSGGGDTIHARPVQLFASGYVSDITALAIGTASTMDLRHYHDIDIEEVTSGANAGKMQVTLGSAVSTSDTTDHIAFFNIADTTTCQNLVSAAKASVNVSKGTWSGGVVTFSPVVGSAAAGGTAEQLTLGMTVTSTSGHPTVGTVAVTDASTSTAVATGASRSVYLYCDNDYAYITNASGAPSGTSDSNVIAYVTNPKPDGSGTITAITSGTLSHDDDEYKLLVPVTASGTNVSSLTKTLSFSTSTTVGGWTDSNTKNTVTVKVGNVTVGSATVTAPSVDCSYANADSTTVSSYWGTLYAGHQYRFRLTRGSTTVWNKYIKVTT